MDRSALLNFNREAAKEREELFGILALIHGEPVTVLTSSSNGTLDLQDAGFRVSGLWRFRLHRDIVPPKVKDVVLKIGTREKFSVLSVVPADENSVSNLYHVIEAQLL